MNLPLPAQRRFDVSPDEPSLLKQK